MGKRLCYSLTRSQFTWLLGQLFVLFMCLVYIQHIYITNILPDKKAKESFKRTSCFLISKKLATKGHLISRYRADFLISYNVVDVQYNRWVTGNGLDRGYIKNEADQEDILSQFEVGGTYPCWYNPESPTQIILVSRTNWFSTFPLIVPATVGMVALYYFVKTLSNLIIVRMSKSPKKHKPRKS